MTKKCYKCGNTYNIEMFAKNKSRSDGHNSMCKQCMKSYDKERFATMERSERDRRNKRRISRRIQHIQLVIDYLSDKQCIDCGNANQIVLEFDHKYNKDYNVADMLGNYKWEVILEEILKCDIRCANCHRIKTSSELGYLRAKLIG